MALPYKIKVTIGFGLMLPLLIFFSWSLHNISDKSNNISRTIIQTHKVIQTLDETLLAAVEIETNTRGYVITSASAFLEPLQSSAKKLDSLTLLLRTMTTDSLQHSNLDLLESYLQIRLKHSDSVINIIKNQRTEVAVMMISSANSRYYIDRLRSQVNLMKNEEANLLAIREEEAKKSNSAETNLLYVNLVLIFGLVFFLFISIWRYPRLLEISKDKLTKQVEEKTASLNASNEKLKTEIEERKRVQETIRVSEERFRSLVENSDEVFYQMMTTDDFLRGELTFVSNRAKTLTGYEPKDFINNKELWISLVHPEDVSHLFDSTQSILSSRTHGIREYRVFSKADAQYHWIQDRVTPLFDSLENLIGYQGIALDITMQKTADDVIQQNHKMLHKLTIKIPAVIYQFEMTTDGIMSFSFISKNIDQFLPAITAEQVMNDATLIFASVHPDDLPFLMESIEVSRQHLTEWNVEFRTITTEGDINWFKGSSRPERKDDGTTLWYGYLEDFTERKLVKEKLSETNRELQTLFDTIDNVIYSVDMVSFRTLQMSVACEKIYGYSPSDFFDNFNLWKEVVHPDDVHIIDANYATMQNSEQVEMQYRIIHKDRSVRWVETTITPTVDGEGNLLRIDGVLHEITERVQAETALRRSEQFNSGVLNSLSSHIAVIAEDGNIIAVNKAWEDFSRENGETILERTSIGSNYFDACKKAIESGDMIAQQAFDGIQAVFSDEQTIFELEYPCHSPSEKRWFLLRVMNFEGEAPQVVVAHVDITARKQAEEEQARSNTLFQALFESSPDGIILVNTSGEIIKTNQRAHLLFGYSKEELLGMSIESLVPPRFKGHDTLRRQYNSNPESRSMGVNRQLYAQRKDGTEFQVEIALNYLQNNNEMNVIATVRDITDNKLLEAQFLRAQRMESIGTLAGGIAHDLNNILAPIMMSVSFIGSKVTDPTSKKMLEMLEVNTNRGAALIKQVLMFARGAEGEHTIVQTIHLIDEIRKIINETFPKSISLHTVIAKNLPTISADATQIHQVLMNLCVNARDSMPNGGKISIVAEAVTIDEQYALMHLDAKPGYYAVITITDQGIGIPPKVLERIFEPFFTTKEIGKGTGLGLSTTISIIKSHRGFVNVYSEVGRGTSFKIYLPAIEDTQSDIVKENDEILMGNGELILVVDDEETIRKMSQLTLELYGYEVITANDGTEAIAEYAVHKNKIALVVTDMMMPHMDGTATVRALQKMNPNVKVIVVSGLKQNGNSVEQGLVKFIHKPYTTEKLLRTIGDLLQIDVE